MRWRKLKSFLLGVFVGGAALFAFVSRADGARRTTAPPRDADPAGEAPPRITRTAERPLVAIVAIGVFFVSLAVLFAWRAVRAEMQADAVAKALTHGDEARAPALMIRYGCAGCHTIAGVPGADGKVGPALSGLVHRVYIGGAAPNTPNNLVRWLLDPQQFAPHSAMPPPGLTPQEARDIAAYLYAH